MTDRATKPETQWVSPRIKPLCRTCGDPYSPQRADAGYNLCLPCGEESAVRARRSWTIAPLNKSAYFLITDPALLKQLNPKRTEA